VVAVVPSALGDDDTVVLDFVYQSVFLVDAAAPEAIHGFEHLGIAYALVRVAVDVEQKCVDSA